MTSILLSIGKSTSRFIENTLKQLHAGTPLPAEVLEQGFRFACMADSAKVFGMLLEVLDQSLAASQPVLCPDCKSTMQPDGKRSKNVVTLVGSVCIQRAVYFCPVCCQRLYPLDRYLNIVGTGYTQCVQSIVTQTAAWESFERSSEWLYECAGITVPTKSVERISESNGQRFQSLMAEQLEHAELSRPIEPAQPPKTLYIEMDGTGIPMRKEVLEGIAGKQADGSATTREFKLGALFTQSAVNEQGVAIRDPDSTTYVGGILDCRTFGERLSGEALRRGHLVCDRLVVLADGASWIWNLSAEHFPGAIEIVDLYHAYEHIDSFCQAVETATRTSMDHAEKKKWKQYLEISAVHFLSKAVPLLNTLTTDGRAAVERTLDYFDKHKHRMWYQSYRAQGLFIGSGVIEGGCKQIIAQRFKKSGMRWTIEGADAIASLRIAMHSGRYHEIWDATRPAHNKISISSVA